jgi:hypothetical protein
MNELLAWLKRRRRLSFIRGGFCPLSDDMECIAPWFRWPSKDICARTPEFVASKKAIACVSGPLPTIIGWSSGCYPRKPRRRSLRVLRSR